MKALSIKQPWAWLIVNGFKDVENRTWSTPFRGEFLIHAGKEADRDAYNYLRRIHPEIPMPLWHALQVGGIVGRARLINCVDWSPSQWFEGPFGFILSDARPVPFRYLKGRLGFFEVVDAAPAVAP